MWVVKNGARVGAAAFALGLSLAGPGLAVAAADEADGATAGVQSQTDTQSSTSTSASTQAHSRRPGAAAAQSQPRQTRVARAATPAATAPGNHTAARMAAKTTPSRRINTAPTTAAPDNTPAAGVDPQAPAASTVTTTAAADAAVETATAPTPLRATAKPVAALSIAGAAATASASDPISALLSPIQSFVEGIGLLIRRTFFNQAPNVTPVQLTGQDAGAITGTVGAVDPEGDPIIYSVSSSPRYGSVDVDPATGAYTYTPGASFTGRDSFTVAATDTGFHINLLDLFRPASTEAYLQIAQGVTAGNLTFTFIYGSGSQYWSQAARAALQASAEQLATYFVVDSPVNVTFDVTAENSPFSGTLASSGSDLVSSDPGFYDTVVQQKILTGVDANGSAADGTIDWNFGQPWAYGSSVDYSQYDFTSTAMHELLHAFGFLSNVDEPAWNLSNRTWTTFDTYMVTQNGTQVIPNTYRWNSIYNTNLTGGNGGLYFGGPNAVAVYGGPVPLYTPNPWEPGSSVSHLDDSTFTGSNTQLMNAISDTGRGIRVVSPIELAILQDIGYTVNTSTSAFLILGFGLIRRRRRRTESR